MLHFKGLEIRTDVFLSILAVVLLLIQLLLCFKVRIRLIRIAPVCLLLGLTAVFTGLIFASDGWDALGFLLLALCAAFLLMVCGMGWGIWWFVRLVKRNGNDRQDLEEKGREE